MSFIHLLWNTLFFYRIFFYCDIFRQLWSDVQGGSAASEVPIFVIQPPYVIYFSRNNNEGHESLSKIEFSFTISPSSVSMKLLVSNLRNGIEHVVPVTTPLPQSRYSTIQLRTHSNYAEYSAISASFDPIDDGMTYGKPQLDTKSWKVTLFNLTHDATVIVLASAELGTVRSRPVSIEQIRLPNFTRNSVDILSVLIGNTAHILCHLPQARPTLPTVQFHQNDILIDLTSEASRYRLIYLGGSGSGVPWETAKEYRKKRLDQLRETNPKSFLSDAAAILLINSVRTEDSGDYRCQARISGRHLMSGHVIRLNVSTPRDRVKPKLRFSSASHEITRLYGTHTDGKSGETISPWTLPDGWNLTLICLFEGAPIVKTQWFYENPNEKIKVDNNFGTLIIESLHPKDEGTYVCSAQVPGGGTLEKSFRIRVVEEIVLGTEPDTIVNARNGQELTLTCNGNTILNETCERIEAGTASCPEIIKWAHNGDQIRRSDSENILVQNSTLHIPNFTQHDEGIFQCWNTDLFGRWSSNHILVKMNHLQIGTQTDQGMNSQSGIIKESTKKGLTAHLNCDLSHSEFHFFNTDERFNGNLTFIWFRSPTIDGTVSLLENIQQANRVKYIRSRVNGQSEVLSILNPEPLEDSGFYVCRVSDFMTGSPLGQVWFELSINPSTEKHVDTHVPVTETVTDDGSQRLTPDSMVIQNSSINNAKDEHPMKLISKPTISRLAIYSLAFYVEWGLPQYIFKPDVVKYFLQSRQRRSMREMVTTNNESVGSSWYDTEQWNISTLTTHFCMLDPPYLRPREVYSFRLRGELLGSARSAMSPFIHSNWSEPISFEDLSSTRIHIKSLYSDMPGRFILNWSLIHPTDLDEHHENLIKLTVLYTSRMDDTNYDLHWITCPPSMQRINSRKSRTFIIPLNISRNSLHDQIILDGLTANHTYAVAIYATFQAKHKQQHFHTLLSQTMIGTTQALSLRPNTSEKNLKMNKHEDDMVEKIKRPSRNQEEDYVLVVILGSLAGVLLVISITLLVLCIWCQVRSKPTSLNASLKGNCIESSLTLNGVSNGATFAVDSRSVITQIDPYMSMNPTTTHVINGMPGFSTASYNAATLKPFWLSAIQTNNDRSAFSWSMDGCHTLTALSQFKQQSCHPSVLYGLWAGTTLHQHGQPFSNGDISLEAGCTPSQYAGTMGKILNTELDLCTNDQSSSIYSQIGSQSTLEELPIRKSDHRIMPTPIDYPSADIRCHAAQTIAKPAPVHALSSPLGFPNGSPRFLPAKSQAHTSLLGSEAHFAECPPTTTQNVMGRRIDSPIPKPFYSNDTLIDNTMDEQLNAGGSKIPAKSTSMRLLHTELSANNRPNDRRSQHDTADSATNNTDTTLPWSVNCSNNDYHSHGLRGHAHKKERSSIHDSGVDIQTNSTHGTADIILDVSVDGDQSTVHEGNKDNVDTVSPICEACDFLQKLHNKRKINNNDESVKHSSNRRHSDDAHKKKRHHKRQINVHKRATDILRDDMAVA